LLYKHYCNITDPRLRKKLRIWVKSNVKKVSSLRTTTQE